MSATDDVLLDVQDLTKRFGIRGRRRGEVTAVSGVSLQVRAGQTLGIVGESGCGKTTTARMMIRLLDPTSGSVHFAGRDITSLSSRAMRPLRRDLQMVFQDPFSALNPRRTVGSSIAAPFQIAGVTPPGGTRQAVGELLERVGLAAADQGRYPHEFSGGQRQRIGIARAIALRPKLIVCDEPVSALDVSVQAQVLNLLAELQDETGVGYVLVAHDLAVVRHLSHRVAVMYLGRVVEVADRDALYDSPLHPYTHALLSAVPLPADATGARRERIRLQGDPPSPVAPPSGCVFRTRCWKAQDRCRDEVPALDELRPDHLVACHFPEESTAAGRIIVGPAPPQDDPVLTARPVPHPLEVISEVAPMGTAEPSGAEFVDPRDAD